MKTPNPKAAIYARVSSHEQTKDGYGLEDQIKKCKAALTLKDWELYDIYMNEKGISGTTTIEERPELKRLIEDAKKGLFTCVAFRALDRIGRDTWVTLGILKEFDKLGILYFSCLEQLDSSTIVGRMMINQIANFAQYEKEINCERMGFGLKIVLEKYGERGGPVPYGYKRGLNKKGDYIEIHEEEAKVIKIIFEERAKNISYERIGKYLDKNNLAPRKAKTWSGKTINQIVSNKEKYMGGIRNETNTEGIRWPIILEKEPFQ